MQICTSLMIYSHNCTHSSASVNVYIPFVGLFCVARFDLMGYAKALHRGTSDGSWLHVLFLYAINTNIQHTALGVMRDKNENGMSVTKYTFSGHESFTCKSLWLKKGYDFIRDNKTFNSLDSVVELGVGKNMVASIRYWMRAFGLTENDKPNTIADYLFDSNHGKDPYIEDLGTLWLLHFFLVSKCEATLYNMLFTKLQRERKVFDRQHVLNLVKRMMTENGKQGQYNENTVKKDIGTLLLNYVLPQKAKALDDYTALLIDLDLIRSDADGKSYQFNIEGKRQIPWQIFLYAIIKAKGRDMTVSYDTLQELGLMFCMNDMEVIEMCKAIVEHHKDTIAYSDVAGIRQLHFLNNLNEEEVLDEYYD